jgi:hypothetical protein
MEKHLSSSSGVAASAMTVSVKNNGARASTPAMRAGGSRTAVSFIHLRVAASAMTVNNVPWSAKMDIAIHL